MKRKRIGILHYSAPPVIGGVEAVIRAHGQLFYQHGYPTTIIAGSGDQSAIPEGVNYIHVPEIGTQYPAILEANSDLEKGLVPKKFGDLRQLVYDKLLTVIADLDVLIVHNAFSKHFNLPLTAALFLLLEEGNLQSMIAWSHDFTWTSPNSRNKVHEGYPWDLLRTFRKEMRYVVVSKERQRTLATLFNCGSKEISIIYNGVDPVEVLGLTDQGFELIKRLGLLESELNLLMPVRVTKAKNIEYAIQVTAALKVLGVKPKLVISGPPDPHDPESMEYFNHLLHLSQESGVEAEVNFVYRAGKDKNHPLLIDMLTVADLLRVSDIVFMPSHREGFGMPVLEAGLAGIPVVSTDIPAAGEIGAGNVTIIDAQAPAAETARRIIQVVRENPVSNMRQKIRLRYTWEAIFRNDIQPLIEKNEDPT